MSEWVGLNELANNANLTFVAFIAFVLIAALGVRFGLYAYWNGRATDNDAQIPLWGYLLFIGVFSMLYGLFGILRIVLRVFGDAIFNLASGFILALTLFLALALRSVYANMSAEGSGTDDDARLVVSSFGLLVVGSTLGMVLLPEMRRPFAAVHGLAGLLFLGYGYRFGQRQLSQLHIQGTLLDTLLRHLLPVLLFASLVPILELAWVLGLPRAVVLYIQIVFVIMTATTLMTATIKLRQNLVGMRG